MRKNQSSKYWAERAAALELEIQQDAAAEAERVKRIYERAVRNVNNDIDIVFRNFSKHLGIDEARARELIEAAENDRELAELQKLLEDATDAAEQDEILQRINAQAYGARISRLEAVKSNIYIEMRKAAQAERLIHTALSAKAIQKAYYTTIHDTAQGLNCGVSFSIIPKRAVEQLQKAQWLGSEYSSRIWKNNTQFISQLQRTIEDGVTAGHSIDRMAQQLRDFVNEESGKSPVYVTERLVRTETAHFMTEGQAAAYEEIGMETYRFLAALSERTCEACAALDGNIYRMAERVPGMNYPPIHPNCRCVTINGDFIPKTRIARDPLDGKNYKVDGSMTYEQWKASLTQEQKQAMELHVKEYRREQRKKIVDKSDKSGIIKMRSGTVALENQRYGRNKDTLVNKTYIESGKYRRKFDNISDNKEVNKTLYECAKTALKHRSGTKFEDMYWIDGNTGKIIASALNEKHESKVAYSKGTAKMLRTKDNVVAIHTHPASMPPSIADFNSAFANGYRCGYIACHNGKVFAYTSQENIREDIYNLYVKKYMLSGLDEFESQLKAIENLKRNYKIDFWEV